MILQSFATQKVFALVVEPQAQTRAMMQQVLRELGIKSLAAETSKDTIGLLVNEKFDWVLMPANTTDSFNFMHLLGHAIRSPHWRDTRVSLLLSGEADLGIVSSAMQLGCLSWHQGPFAKDAFTNEVKRFLDRLFSYGFNYDLVAASYVRELAAKLPMPHQMSEMERYLTRVHPTNFKALMESAQSFRSMGEYESALLLTRKARLIEEQKNSTSEQMYKDILDEMAKTGKPFDREFSAQDVLGIRSLAIVDSDVIVQQQIEKSLNEVGLKDIACFSNGQEFID